MQVIQSYIKWSLLLHIFFAPPLVRAQLLELERRVQSVIASAAPSTVTVKVASGHDFNFGSGFLLQEQGSVKLLTSYHLIASADTGDIFVRFLGQDKFSKSSLLNFDKQRDLASLRLPKSTPNVTPLELASSSPENLVGRFIIAIGNPGGVEFSTSFGMVSAANRVLEEALSAQEYLQLDAKLSPGSSGGAVVSLDGRLLGMVSRSGAGGIASFAIPAEDIRAFLREGGRAKSKEKQQLGFLGAIFQPYSKEFKRALNVMSDGVLVAGVVRGSPADRYGFRVGDLVLRMSGRKVIARTDYEVLDFVADLRSQGPSSVEFLLDRQGDRINLTPKLVSSLGEPPGTQEGSRYAVLPKDRSRYKLELQTDSFEVIQSWNLSKWGAARVLKGDRILGLLDSDRKFDPRMLLNGSNEPMILRIIRNDQPRLAIAGEE